MSVTDATLLSTDKIQVRERQLPIDFELYTCRNRQLHREHFKYTSIFLTQNYISAFFRKLLESVRYRYVIFNEYLIDFFFNMNPLTGCSIYTCMSSLCITNTMLIVFQSQEFNQYNSLTNQVQTQNLQNKFITTNLKVTVRIDGLHQQQTTV